MKNNQDSSSLFWVSGRAIFSCCFQQTRGPMTWLTIVETFLPQAHDTIVGKWPPHKRLDNVMTDDWAFPGLPKLLEFYERCLGIEDLLPRAFLFFTPTKLHMTGWDMHCTWLGSQTVSPTNVTHPIVTDTHSYLVMNPVYSSGREFIKLIFSFPVLLINWSLWISDISTYLPHIHFGNIPGGSLVGRWLPRDADPAPWRLRGVAGPEAPRELQPAGPGFGGGAADTGRVSKLLIYDSANIVWCCISVYHT